VPFILKRILVVLFFIYVFADSVMRGRSVLLLLPVLDEN